VTCIVGVANGKSVWIGGDSAGVEEDGGGVTIRADRKVFANGRWIFGFAGSFRVGDLLRYVFTAPEIPTDPAELDSFMVTDFVEQVRNVLVQGGVTRIHHNVEEMDSKFLVGVHGRLFCIDSDLQVGESMETYEAIGAGERYALGSLWGSGHLTARQRILLALEAAAHFNGGVAPPFHVVSTARGRGE
jgi:ATP-dependent protease HslVU (ClpYQ) peptidase subunit